MQEAEEGDASRTQTIDRVPEKRKGLSPSLTPLDSTPAKRSFSAPLHGRRIVHLRYLAVGLSACQNPGCGKPLALIDCVEEKRYGLGSVLVIPCQQCGMENFIDTDSPVTAQHPGPVLPQATPKLLWVSAFFNLIRFIHDICESLPPDGYGNV